MRVAKAKKAREREAEEVRIAEEEEAAAAREAKLDAARERHAQLRSVVDTLYGEVDKLARKWPDVPVTQRTVDRTNKAICAVRELLEGEEDDFVDDIDVIVPAGDLPPNRDVTMLLGELKAALVRFRNKLPVEREYPDLPTWAE